MLHKYWTLSQAQEAKAQNLQVQYFPSERREKERVEVRKWLLLFFFIFFLLFTICVTSTSSMLTFFPRATYHFTSLSQANSPKPKISYKTQYFPQQLDHFTFQPNSYKIFYQKYLINNHYWQHGAPIFVYTVSLSMRVISNGLLPTLASCWTLLPSSQLS